MTSKTGGLSKSGLLGSPHTPSLTGMKDKVKQHEAIEEFPWSHNDNLSANFNSMAESILFVDVSH